jgi:hypothetical protein
MYLFTMSSFMRVELAGIGLAAGHLAKHSGQSVDRGIV